MSILSDITQLIQGNYITVQEVSTSFEIPESEARGRLDVLANDKDVLKQLPGKDRYGPSERIRNMENGTTELKNQFNKEFSKFQS